MSGYSSYAYLYNAYAFSRWFGHKKCNKKVPNRELGLKLHMGQVSKVFITTLAEHGKKSRRGPLLHKVILTQQNLKKHTAWAVPSKRQLKVYMSQRLSYNKF